MSTYVTALIAGPYHVVRDHHDGIDPGHLLPVARWPSTWTRTGCSPRPSRVSTSSTARSGSGTRSASTTSCSCRSSTPGAMENAGAVTFREEYVFRSRVTRYLYERRCETILHEMAHMWFGDLVTMRWWDDLWLNESFATWASVRRPGRRPPSTPRRGPRFANVEKSWAYVQDQLPSTHPIAADMVDLAAVEVNFDGITYAKGASVLKQLAAYVGLRGVPRRAAGLLRRRTRSATPPWTTCWPRWSRPPAGTCPAGRRLAGDHRAEHAQRRRSTSTTTACITRFEVVQSGAEPGRRRAAPASARGRRLRRDGAGAAGPHPPGRTRRRRRAHRGARSGRRQARALWCWSTTTT